MAPTPQPPFWYQALIQLIKPLYRRRVKKRSGLQADYHEEVQQRFGQFQAVKNQQAIWFHAVSVGETNAAQPLIAHYLALGQAVLLTNTTRTGQARGKALFAQHYPQLFQAVFLPLDQYALMARFIELNQPRILLLMETELWPNLLSAGRRAGIPQLLLNARLSAKSARGYGRFKRLSTAMLAQLNAIAAQDDATVQRFAALGKDPTQMQVLGNIKFDSRAPQQFIDQAQQLKQDWQLQHRQIMVLASTHAPEEQALLTALQQQLQQQPQQLCIVVPRHPERFDEVAKLITDLGLQLKRRSRAEAISADTQVYLADSMGEMWLWYALAEVAYVGGSLNQPGGGHNILEPIALNVATIVGCRYVNFQHIVDTFAAQQALMIVDDAPQAAQQLQDLLANGAQRQQICAKASQILSANQGALARHIALIDRFLEAP
jgi:3-deoxy-D-manno-octulosonic-acid transferase